MRIAMYLLIMLAFVCCSNDVRAQTKPSDAADEVKAQTVLDTTLPSSLKFDHTHLGDVMSFLVDISGIKLHVDWKAFAKVKVTETSVVTEKMEDVKLSEAIRRIFRAAGAKVDPSIEVTGDRVITIKPGKKRATTTKASG